MSPSVHGEFGILDWQMGLVADHPKSKQRRASKPKVKTGCYTCKVRHVKCDETRPACLKCSTTGRKCDGYDKGSPSQFFKARAVQAAQKPEREVNVVARIARDADRSFLRLKILAADIEGSGFERICFQRFRAATAKGFVIHTSNVSSFWSRVVPLMAHQEQAIKHAIIALGSTYQLFHRPDEDDPMGFSRDQLEVFSIHHYNRAIALLQDIGQASKDDDQASLIMTLICCLTFICLESLRLDYDAAFTHLQNGLRILCCLPDHHFEFLGRDDAFGPSHSTNLDIEDIIRIFSHLECAALLHRPTLVPVVCRRGYDFRRYDDGLRWEQRGFADLHEMHSTKANVCRDLCQRLWETANHVKDDEFWADPDQQRMQQCLRLRLTRVLHAMRRFLSGPQMPPPNTQPWFSAYLDYVGFVGVRSLLQGFDAEREAYELGVEELNGLTAGDRMVSAENAALYTEVLDIVIMLHDSPLGQTLGYRGPSPIASTTQPHTSTIEHSSPSSGTTSGSSPGSASGLSSDASPSPSALAPSSKQDRGPQPPRRVVYTCDTGGFVGPLVCVATNGAHPYQRRQAIEILKKTYVRETLWDGPTLAVHAEEFEARMPRTDITEPILGTAPVSRLLKALQHIRIGTHNA